MNPSVLNSIAEAPVDSPTPPRFADFLLVAAHAPLVAAYYLRLWELPHYQFFPLALLGALVLFRRATSMPRAVDGQTPFASAIWGFGLLLLTTAVLFDSPWLGATAAMVNWSAWQLSRGRTWSAVLPAAAMIAVTLRPPLGIDTWLIHRLQQVTARAADVTLDVLGVLHMLAGNVIELPEHRLLVEEACSGVNSLFSSGAAVLFYLLWNRRGWISSGLLCLSIPIWVVFANVIRVVAVAVLRARWDIAADTGALHTVLGLATFVLAVGMILSTERFLRFYTLLVERTPPIESISELSSSPPTRAGIGADRLYKIVGLTAAVIGCVQIPALANGVNRFASEWRTDVVPDFGATWIDESCAPWHRTVYETVARDRNSPFGRHSQIWSLERAEQRGVLSLDYPFYGWHELTECYEAQGWQAESRQVLEATAGETPTVAVALRHAASGRYGRLYFGLMTRDGRPYAARRLGEVDEWLDRAAGRLRELAGGDSGTAAPEPDRVTYQAQFFVESYTPITSPVEKESYRLFQNFTSRLHDRLASDVAAHSAGGTP